VASPAGLRVVNAGAAAGTAGVSVLPPTEGGWQAFLAQAAGSGLKFGELAEAGRWWWGRSIPRNLLSGEDDNEAGDVGEGAASSARDPRYRQSGCLSAVQTRWAESASGSPVSAAATSSSVQFVTSVTVPADREEITLAHTVAHSSSV